LRKRACLALRLEINDIGCMNLNYSTRQSNPGSEFLTMIFRFETKHLIVFGSLFFLTIGVGCNQQRYKPAKWRAAQRNMDAKEQSSPAGAVSGGTSAWAAGREIGTMPIRGGGTMPIRGGGTMPLRGGGTLPSRGWGTLPNRGTGSTIPNRQFQRGSTMPQWRWQPPAAGNSTLPQRR